MIKIPVGETIRHAYRFAFGHLGAIIGLVWLPMVLVTVAGFFATQRYYAEFAAAMAQNNFANMGPAVLMMLGYFAIELLFYAMMLVSVTELALGSRAPGALVHFAFGKSERRMFRALGAFVGVLLVPVLFVVAIANYMLGGAFGQGPLFLGIVAGLLVLDLAIIFVALRFGFFMVPVATAEEGKVLERAWILSAGNFWRILLIVVAATGPVLLLIFVLQVALLNPGSFSVNLNPTQADAAAQLARMRTAMPLIMGIGFFVSPLILGLFVGATSFAYRVLTRAGGGNPAITPPP